MIVDKFESGGMFGLSLDEDCFASSYDGSLGGGGATSLYRFSTEEGREYFIQAEDLRRKLARSVAEAESYRRTISEMSTVKGAWRNFRMAVRKRIRRR